MILRGNNDKTGRPADAGGATLDDLFRRAGVQSASSPALRDPPNRESFTDHAPRQLTYAQADRAISALAAKLVSLGLHADAVVAVQLPNVVENVIALLAVLRARLIAVPLPLLWRQRDMTAALDTVGAKAIITTARVGEIAHAELAMDVAAKLFSIRFVCSFGIDIPDGVVSLDDIFTAEQTSVEPQDVRPGNAADHIAVVTFDVTRDGIVPVARNHAQLVAGGASIRLAAVIARKAEILSAVPPSSFAGIAASLVPWLTEGGTLSLHQGFDPAAFAAQSSTLTDGVIVLPGPTLAPLAAVSCLDAAATVVALWRSPEQLTTAAAWRGTASVIDVASFGEIGFVASARHAAGVPANLPRGVTGSFEPAGRAIETLRIKSGTLGLRGAMVPGHVFPPGSGHGGEPCLKIGEGGFIDTGFTCRPDPGNESLIVTGPPGGMAVIGGYRFRTRDLESQVALADPTATVVALPAGVMVQRLAGSAIDKTMIRARLRKNGANPLIAGAFRRLDGGNAA